MAEIVEKDLNLSLNLYLNLNLNLNLYLNFNLNLSLNLNLYLTRNSFRESDGGLLRRWRWFRWLR
jgi:hypothetical protein